MSSIPPKNFNTPPDVSSSNNPSPPRVSQKHSASLSTTVKGMSKFFDSNKLVNYLAEEIKKMKISLSLSKLLKTLVIKRDFLKSLEEPSKKDNIPGNVHTREYTNKDFPLKPRDKGQVHVVDAQITIYKEKIESPPFILTLRIFGKNLHNFLVDLGASINVMPLSVYQVLGLSPAKSLNKVTQLDKFEVNVTGELTHIHM